MSTIPTARPPATPPRGRPLTDGPQRLPTHWKLVVACVVLIPLLALVSDWFMVAEYKKAVAKAAPPPEPALLALPAAETSPSVPGDLLSDLQAALDEGVSSPLVDLGSPEEQKVFERLQGDAPREGDQKLTLFRQGSTRDGVRVYEARNAREEPLGIIQVERRQSRWHVVGAGAAKGGASRTAEKDDRPKSEAISGLQSLLQHPDEDVRDAAAAALKEIGDR